MDMRRRTLCKARKINAHESMILTSVLDLTSFSIIPTWAPKTKEVFKKMKARPPIMRH